MGSGLDTLRPTGPTVNDREAAGDSASDSAWPRLSPYFLPRCGLRLLRDRKGGSRGDPPLAGKGQERGGAREECAEALVYPGAGRPSQTAPLRGLAARVPHPRRPREVTERDRAERALSPAMLQDPPCLPRLCSRDPHPASGLTVHWILTGPQAPRRQSPPDWASGIPRVGCSDGKCSAPSTFPRIGPGN